MRRNVTGPRYSLRTLLIVVSVVGVAGWMGSVKLRRDRMRNVILNKYGAVAEFYGGTVALEFHNATNLSELGEVRNIASIKFKYPVPDRLPTSFFGNLQQLESLSFNGQHLTRADFDRIAHLTNLKELSLARTNVTVDDLARLRSLPELRRLDLTGTSLNDSAMAELSQFPKLQTLVLNFIDSLTDAGLRHLGGCENLRSLHAQNTSVTPRGVARLQRELPTCSIIHRTP